MKNIQRGETVCFPEERRDEIGELGRAFKQMTKQIDEMLLEVAEAKQLQNEAQMNVPVSYTHLFFAELRGGAEGRKRFRGAFFPAPKPYNIQMGIADQNNVFHEQSIPLQRPPQGLSQSIFENSGTPPQSESVQ